MGYLQHNDLPVIQTMVPIRQVGFDLLGDDECKNLGKGYVICVDDTHLIWELRLTNGAVEELERVGAVIGAVGAYLTQPQMVAISKAISVVVAVNAIGGKKGVGITGFMASSQIVITPRKTADGPSYGWEWAKTLSQKSGETLRDFWSHLLSMTHRRRSRHKKYGRLVANRLHRKEFERFTFLNLNDGRVAISTHSGFICHPERERKDGDSPVRADEPYLLDRTKWNLQRNDDGSITLLSHEGLPLRWSTKEYPLVGTPIANHIARDDTHFRWQEPGGFRLDANWDRETPERNRFWLYTNDDGTVSLARYWGNRMGQCVYVCSQSFGSHSLPGNYEGTSDGERREPPPDITWE